MLNITAWEIVEDSTVIGEARCANDEGRVLGPPQRWEVAIDTFVNGNPTSRPHDVVDPSTVDVFFRMTAPRFYKH